MLIAMYIIIYVFIFIIGCVLGSFMNVLIYRLPRDLNPAKGFSFCPSCNHRLYPKDLFPVFSFIFLKGRCRYCEAKISPRYPIVETLTGIAAVAVFGFSSLPAPIFGSVYQLMIWQAIIIFLAFCILLVITLADADTQIIPDSMNIGILLLGIAAIWAAVPIPEGIGILSRVIGLFCISVPLLIISLIISGAFGMGDVKLMAAAGFLLGWQCSLVAFFIGVLLGGAYGTVVLIRKKKGKGDHFAFGPCLAVGIFVALIFGNSITSWYLNFF